MLLYRQAGLAVAVGTWSSIVVITSFIFGIIVFQERVKHFVPTVLAFLLLIAGLIGMAKYSGQKSPTTKTESLYITTHFKNIIPGNTENYDSSIQMGTSNRSTGNTGGGQRQHVTDPLPQHVDVLEIEPLVAEEEETIMAKEKNRSRDRIIFFGGKLILTKRQLGIMGAVVNGAWGGMNLIPMHYAKKNEGLSGAGYLISYACGAFIVNTLIWVFFFLFYLYQTRSIADTIEALPNWNLEHLWLPGLGAGLLYSIGNFASILAVTYLGQGTGFSFCQMQLFVSGLWGVFFFREIRGTDIITKWFLSAGTAVVGIIWLSYEHEGGTGAH